jgi:hypothetical protein
MIRHLLKAKQVTLFVFFVVGDVICFGMGMGVPILCILFGFPTGWILARRALSRETGARAMLRSLLRASILLSLLTFAMCVVVWGQFVPWIFDGSRDLTKAGTPLILYTPKASLIGWLILMVVISPILQAMTTICAAVLTVCLISDLP